MTSDLRFPMGASTPLSNPAAVKWGRSVKWGRAKLTICNVVQSSLESGLFGGYIAVFSIQNSVIAR